jgi:membrane protease YdiL (CAAX protease family)
MLRGPYLGPMRPLRSLLIYVVVIFLGGALLAPWLYWAGQLAAEHIPRLAKVSTQPFYRYVHRSLLVFAVAGLWPFLRSAGLTSWRAVGLVKPAGNWRRLLAGLAIGFASLACVALLAIASGDRTVKSELPGSVLLSNILSASVTAVVVGFLEELLFRGGIFGALREASHWTMALVVSSALYALVHFFNEKPVSPVEITWFSGLDLLPRMLHGLVEVEKLVPGVFTLLLAGMILGLAYQRTGNLYLSIGMHVGWIFWLRFYGAMSVANSDANQWFWGSGKLIDSWVAPGILLPVLLGLCLYPSKTDLTPNAG